MTRLFVAFALALSIVSSLASAACAQDVPTSPFGAPPLVVPPVIGVPAGGYPVFDGAVYQTLQDSEQRQAQQQQQSAQQLWLNFNTYQQLGNSLHGLSETQWSQSKSLMQSLAQLISNAQTLTVNQQNLSTSFNRLYPEYQDPANYRQNWIQFQALMNQAGLNLTTQTENTVKTNTQAAATANEANANIDAATASKNKLAVTQTAAHMSAAMLLALTNMTNLMAAQAQLQNVYMNNVSAEKQQTHSASEGGSNFWGSGRAAMNAVGQTSGSHIDPAVISALGISPSTVTSGIAPPLPNN